MQRERLIAIGLIGGGMLVTVLVGLGLATAPVTLTEDAGAILLPALGAFVVAMPMLLGGAYLLIKTNQPTEANPEMARARALLDVLRGRGVVSLAQVADEMAITPAQAEGVLEDLLRLKIFNGIWDKRNGQAGILDLAVLQTLERCAVCEHSLTLAGAVTRCEKCGTVYARSTEAP